MAFGGVLQVAAQTPEENKALILYDIEEVWNKGNLDVADEVIAADYVHYRTVEFLPQVEDEGGSHAIGADEIARKSRKLPKKGLN